MITSKVKTVKDLFVTEEAEIVGFDNHDFICRFYTLGIRINSKISLIRKVPFGGAFYVKVGDSLIALRKNEADSIIIQ